MNKELPLRSEVPAHECWQLGHLFDGLPAWEKAFADAKALVESLPAMRGTLGSSPQALRSGLAASFQAQLACHKLYAYARMLRDEDNQNTAAQGICDRAGVLVTALSTAASFIQPELLAMPEDTLRAYMTEPDIADYRRFLQETLLLRPHTLPEREEELLAMAGDMAQGADTIYDMLTDADLVYPEVPDGSGGQVQLSHGRYLQLLESRNPDVRLAAYEGMMGTYAKFRNTIAASYATSLKGDTFYARARGYASSLQAALYPNEIPESVYHSLLTAIHAHLPSLERYVSLRGKILGLSSVRFCDLYVPMYEGFDVKIPYGEAFDLCASALRVLGDDYVAAYDQAKTGGWVDVHETRGKTSGAYSWGTYGTHPYVLLNYHESFDAVSTLAHEMGHALHSFFSNKRQPYASSEYPLFLAEVASTVNESLLLDELLRRHTDRDAQRFLLNYRLEQIRTTVIRQSMFAEFEMRTHELAWEGAALTHESLCELYQGIVGSYYQSVQQDEWIKNEWMRIPHFYRAFYVYQYATGFSSAACIAQRIAKEGAPAAAAYRDFLSLGGSLPPLEALRVAGVDLSTPAPVEACLRLFEETMAKLQALA